MKQTSIKHRCGLQATLDEQRQAMVHQVMLENLQQKLAGFSHSVAATAWKGVEQAADVTALPTSGDTELLKLHILEASVLSEGGAQAAVITTVGRQDLAWGSSDIVVFVRHEGLLVAANESITQVQYPAGNGSWYAVVLIFYFVSL